MKDVQITAAHIVRNPEHRTFLSKVSGYAFVLYFLIPLLAGLILPYFFSLTDQPFASLPMRLMVLIATGGASFLLVMIPAFLLLRTRILKKVYVFLLFPVSVVALATQSIMYKEFGSEIDARLLGLFQGNITALWTFARMEYHIDWVIGGLMVLSVGLGCWVLRSERLRWRPSLWSGLGLASLILAAGSISLAFRPSIERADLYHPTKLSSAPLYQVVSFLGNYYILEKSSGYAGILERVDEITEEDEYSEITLRLGMEPDEFAHRVIERPSWMKKQPSHVFFFLMESIEYDLVENPDLEGVAPYIKRFAEEGISVENFSASSGQTIDAVHTMCSGASSQRRYPVPRALTQFSLDTLPRLMEGENYRPLFFAGSHRIFCLKGDVCEGYGYEKFTGCPDVTDFKSNEWGVCDGDLYPWAHKEMGELETPHFVTFLGVSNHTPHDTPVHELGDVEFSDDTLARFIGRTREEKVNFAKHIKYSDWKMGEMVELLREEHPDALFVFVGDHTSSKLIVDPVGEVPFVLWNDRVVDSSVDASRWYGAHMDLPATLASLILPEGESIRTFGNPLWDLSDERVCSSGRLVITNRGYLNRKGELVERFSGGKAETLEERKARVSRVMRKASAIEALSWGYLHRKVLRGSPVVH